MTEDFINAGQRSSAELSPILVTGGAGFIGANFILDWLVAEKSPVINFDKLTYAGNMENFSSVATDSRLTFLHGDICDTDAVRALLTRMQPRAIVHFAAESHVDRSIHDPEDFIATNIIGTFRLLECVRDYWQRLGEEEKKAFRFVHVSTDEVYGSLLPSGSPFSELNRFEPNSPYAASKAASDHIVRAWHQTYGLPAMTTNCSNNFGPFQFPEKLIPLMIYRALRGEPMPVYGDGRHRRDWLYVTDHCSAIRAVLRAGEQGETYNIGGGNEKANIDVITSICDVLDAVRPRPGGGAYRDQVTFVKDRPGHDRRYAVDSTKITRALGWSPTETFESGLRKTIDWYLSNDSWVQRVVSGAYRSWIEQNYSERQ